MDSPTRPASGATASSSTSRCQADFFPAERTGYSGVALYSRDRPDEIERCMGVPEYDVEGRYQSARFGAPRIVNCYLPNGGGKNRDNSRVPFKLDFYCHLFDMLEDEKERGGRIVVMGDFNTAVEEIDLARPRQNTKAAGFLPEEREELRRWLAAGWIDSFRHFNSDPGHYTWWSQRAGAREKNIGWRIDYHLVSPALLPFLRSARIAPSIMGSDHCPLEVVLDGAALRVRKETNVPPHIPSSGHLRPMPQSCNPRRRLRLRLRLHSVGSAESDPNLGAI